MSENKVCVLLLLDLPSMLMKFLDLSRSRNDSHYSTGMGYNDRFRRAGSLSKSVKYAETNIGQLCVFLFSLGLEESRVMIFVFFER